MTPRRFTCGDLFAGIGGFSLGFERAGFDTLWQVEINEWGRKVLAKRFPHAERYGDIRECGKHNLKPVDVICGGFPCQDISNAGLRAGIEGERSGLWLEMCRVISELRPRFALVENVAALLGRGFGRVIGDLSEIGYDAEWEVVSAADVGAPHLRERVWILAYPHLARLQGRNGAELREHTGERISGTSGSYARPEYEGSDWWIAEPSVGRVVNGVSHRVDRLKGIGNAVVPQIPEMYARRIRAALAIERQRISPASAPALAEREMQRA